MQEITLASFKLNPEMLALLNRDFSIEGLVSKFNEAITGKDQEEINKIGQHIFEEYGRMWIRKAIELRDAYPDGKYEKIRELIDRSPEDRNLIPQCVLEVAYLGTHEEIDRLDILESSPRRVAYMLEDNCLTYGMVKEKCGEEVAKMLLCKHACLTACDVLFKDLDFEAEIEMEAAMNKDGCCQFSATLK